MTGGHTYQSAGVQPRPSQPPVAGRLALLRVQIDSRGPRRRPTIQTRPPAGQLNQGTFMNSNPTFSARLQQAMAASASGDLQTAISLFRTAVQEEPTSPLPSFLLGAELAQAGRIEEAIQAYATATLIAPEVHMARYQLGLLQFTSGQAALSLVTWQPLLALPATDPLSAFVKGFAEMASDRFVEALGHFRSGQALNTENAPLNADIQMVIDRIEALRHSQGATPSAAMDQRSEPLSDASHVLLSNYRGGSVH